MRLKSIRLRNYRGVEDREVVFGPGVTIVEGENEAGKTSLMEAIRFLRLYPHSSKRQEIKNVQPVGKDVGPEVTLRATVGSDDVVYTKRWLRQPAAELRVRGKKHEDHAGPQAHTRFNELLEGTLDLDLLDALEVVQGQSLAQPELGRISTLRSALVAAPEKVDEHEDGAGAPEDEGAGPDVQGDDLMQKVEAEYAKYYTKRGHARGRLKDVPNELAQVEGKLAALKDRRAEAEEFTEKLADLSAQSIEVTDRLERAKAAEAAATQKQEKVRQAERAALEAQASVDALRGAVELAESRLARRLDLLKRQAEADGAVTAAEEALQKAKAADQPAKHALEQATKQAAQANENWKATQQHLAQAAQAEARLEQTEELRDLQATLSRIRKALSEQEAAASRAAQYVVDDVGLAKLRTLEVQVLQAKSALEAASATVVVERLSDEAQVSVDGMELARPADKFEQTVSQPLVIEVPGQVRVTVAPAQTSGSYEQQYRQAETQLSNALEAAGAISVSDAEEQNTERQKAKADEGAAAERLADLTAERSAAEVEERISQLTTDLSGGLGDASTAVPEATAGSLDAARTATVKARQREQQTRDLHTEADQALRTAQFAVETAEADLSRAQTALVEAEERQKAARTQLSDSAGGTDSVNEEALRKDLARAQIKLDDGTRALTEAQQALDALEPARTALELKESRAEVVRLQTRRQTLANEETKTKAVLDRLVAEGLHTKVGEAESQLASLKDEMADLTRKAGAARTLWEVLTKHHTAAQEKYAGPLEDALRELGAPVFGPDFDVEVSSDLQIVSRSDGQTNVPFESLSAGAREQLSVLGRLAAATLVDEKGAPLILDDTLGFSDPGRLESLGQVFSDVADKAQVVILTCQPDRYDSAEGAHVVKI